MEVDRWGGEEIEKKSMMNRNSFMGSDKGAINAEMDIKVPNPVRMRSFEGKTFEGSEQGRWPLPFQWRMVSKSQFIHFNQRSIQRRWLLKWET
ncbi:hypothetical protein QYF36_003646 [Acer negundo]|nr:hypothetical protein QYF36_003646 [Acer negundo]